MYSCYIFSNSYFWGLKISYLRKLEFFVYVLKCVQSKTTGKVSININFCHFDAVFPMLKLLKNSVFSKIPTLLFSRLSEYFELFFSRGENFRAIVEVICVNLAKQG